jgi:hypothetical protein
VEHAAAWRRRSGPLRSGPAARALVFSARAPAPAFGSTEREVRERENTFSV